MEIKKPRGREGGRKPKNEMGRRIHTSIRLDQDLAIWLETECEQRNIGRNDLVNELLRQSLEARPME